ncbi:CD209 antigen-like protein E isoform X2 [Chanodichthys erythropterus]|uniref:CD209 antigen-like protein E isoform X2 n=1 Tax=Chanodichthys erythropterus TaxID=933992 RepID=UPI00351F3728
MLRDVQKEQNMESETFDIPRNINNTSGPQTQSHREDEGKAQERRGSRCLVLITVSLGLICVLQLIFIILQYFMITAEREEMKSHKSKAEELDQTRFCIKANNTELTLDLESSVTSSSDQSEKKASKQENMCALDGFFTSFEEKNWSDSRHFCQDRGGYLVMIKSEEKQRLVTSFMKKRINKNVWIGLSDTENEGIMKWVDNSTLNEGVHWCRKTFTNRGPPSKEGTFFKSPVGHALNHVKIRRRKKKRSGDFFFIFDHVGTDRCVCLSPYSAAKVYMVKLSRSKMCML